MAALPMPLPAAKTRTSSPGCTFPRVTSICQAVNVESVTAAAASALTSSGIATRLEMGATTYSAKPPSRKRPRISPLGHEASSPLLHHRHTPQHKYRSEEHTSEL